MFMNWSNNALQAKMLRLVGMLLILESFDPNILVLTRLKFLQAPREVQYHIKIQFGAFSHAKSVLYVLAAVVQVG